MKIKSIEAFLATVETGSIRAAARELKLSQPAISKTLKALEDEVGAPLLTRGTKGIDMTDYGKAFFIRATTISQESNKAIEEIRQMRGEVNGRVDILLSPVSAMQLGPYAIQQFRRSHGDVKINVLEGLEPLALEKLRSSEIDFAVCAAASKLSNKEFEVHPLRDIPMAVIARKGHPQSDETTLRRLQLSDWVQIGAGSSRQSLIDKFFIQSGLTPPDIAMECQSFTSSFAMILNTDMLGLAPEAWTDNPYYSNQFTRLNLIEGHVVNRLQLIHRRDKPLTPVAQMMATYFLRLADI